MKKLNPNLKGLLFFTALVVPIAIGYAITLTWSGGVEVVSILGFLWMLFLVVLLGNRIFVVDAEEPQK